MIIDIHTRSTVAECSEPPSQRNNDAFRTLMAQSPALPLFSPWAAGELNARSNTLANDAELNTHRASSNRREGRHTHR